MLNVYILPRIELSSIFGIGNNFEIHIMQLYKKLIDFIGNLTIFKKPLSHY